MRIQITDIDTDTVQASDLDGPGFATFDASEFDALSTGELASILREGDV